LKRGKLDSSRALIEKDKRKRRCVGPFLLLWLLVVSIMDGEGRGFLTISLFILALALDGWFD